MTTATLPPCPIRMMPTGTRKKAKALMATVYADIGERHNSVYRMTRSR